MALALWIGLSHQHYRICFLTYRDSTLGYSTCCISIDSSRRVHFSRLHSSWFDTWRNWIPGALILRRHYENLKITSQNQAQCLPAKPKVNSFLLHRISLNNIHLNHRSRINTEAINTGKGRRCCLGNRIYSIPCRTIAILEKDEFILSSNHHDAKHPILQIDLQ